MFEFPGFGDSTSGGGGDGSISPYNTFSPGDTKSRPRPPSKLTQLFSPFVKVRQISIDP